MIVILLLIAIFLISNTISVGITVRKDEIGIMKYIGATDSFVRAPFLLEGMILGLIGAGIPLIILYFCYNNVVTYVYTKFSVLLGVVDFISGWTDLPDTGSGGAGTGNWNWSCGKLYYYKKTLEGVRVLFYNKAVIRIPPEYEKRIWGCWRDLAVLLYKNK